MAFLEDIFEGWSTGGLVGIGIVLAAPAIVPIIGAVVRPIAQGLGQGLMVMTDTVWSAVGATAAGVREVANETGSNRTAQDTSEETEGGIAHPRDQKRQEARAKQKKRPQSRARQTSRPRGQRPTA